MNDALDVQWLSDLLRSRVRVAGFTPCLRVDHLTTVDTRIHPDSLAWVEWQEQPTPRCTFRRMGDAIAPVVQQINAHELLIKGRAVPLARPIMIADCMHAEVHTQADIIPTPAGVHIVLEQPLHFTYQPPVYYAEWVRESFFIRARKLYYQHHRVDQLSAQITDFSVELVKQGPYTWVNWLLQRDNGQTWPLLTRVRAA